MSENKTGNENIFGLSLYIYQVLTKKEGIHNGTPSLFHWGKAPRESEKLKPKSESSTIGSKGPVAPVNVIVTSFRAYEDLFRDVEVNTSSSGNT